jgi:hypothetical protein
MTAGTCVLLALIGGGAAGIAALTKQEPRVVTATAMGRETDTATHAAGAGAAPTHPEDRAAVPPVTGRGLSHADAARGATVTGSRMSDEADRTATREPRASGTHKAAPAATKSPTTGATSAATSQTVTETREIPYRTQLVRDPSMPRGSRRVQAAGVPGVETVRYLVTYAGGKETDRRVLDSVVTKAPRDRVLVFGGRGGGGRDHTRECGPDLGHCLLGRRACLQPTTDPAQAGGAPTQEGAPTPKGGTAQAESGVVRLGGSLALTDQDVALLDASDLDNLDGLEMDPSLVC